MTQRNIIAAIAKAKGQVRRLHKSERNKDQNYNFASVDDFLAMCGPICAENGLVTVMDEEEVTEFERQGKYGTNFWLRIRFSIKTHHESGDYLEPVRRSVEVIRTGAQSFGSAQSYVLKQYLRGLLEIPTGDQDDADFAEKGEGKPTASVREDARQRREPIPDPIAEADAFAGRIAAALKGIEAQKTLADLGAYWSDLTKHERAVAADAAVIRAKDARKAKLADPIAADEIPY